MDGWMDKWIYWMDGYGLFETFCLFISHRMFMTKTLLKKSNILKTRDCSILSTKKLSTSGEVNLGGT